MAHCGNPVDVLDLAPNDLAPTLKVDAGRKIRSAGLLVELDVKVSSALAILEDDGGLKNCSSSRITASDRLRPWCRYA